MLEQELTDFSCEGSDNTLGIAGQEANGEYCIRRQISTNFLIDKIKNLVIFSYNIFLISTDKNGTSLGE